MGSKRVEIGRAAWSTAEKTRYYMTLFGHAPADSTSIESSKKYVRGGLAMLQQTAPSFPPYIFQKNHVRGGFKSLQRTPKLQVSSCTRPTNNATWLPWLRGEVVAATAKARAGAREMVLSGKGGNDR